MKVAAIQRTEEIFCGALEVSDVAQRQAFLDDACAGDAAARAAVEELLAAHTKADQFFQESAPAVAPAMEALQAFVREQNIGDGRGTEAALEDAEGQQIGPYKVLQKIGEGGCGVVFMAKQEQPVRRHVALKIIKLGMDTRNVIARFKAEQLVEFNP